MGKYWAWKVEGPRGLGQLKLVCYNCQI
jgi:hypothetical protein